MLAPRGRLWPKITTAYTTDAGETPALQAFAAGATLARNHQRLHNHRRRDACFLCFAERLKAIARHSPRGRLWQEITNACTTIAGETPALQAFAAGATTAIITNAYTPDAGESPAVSALLGFYVFPCVS